MTTDATPDHAPDGLSCGSTDGGRSAGMAPPAAEKLAAVLRGVACPECAKFGYDKADEACQDLRHDQHVAAMAEAALYHLGLITRAAGTDTAPASAQPSDDGAPREASGGGGAAETADAGAPCDPQCLADRGLHTLGCWFGWRA